jgi:integrase
VGRLLIRKLQVRVLPGPPEPPGQSRGRWHGRAAARRRVAQAKDALACGTTLAADTYVFSHVPDGSKPTDSDAITHRFQRLARRLGVRCRLHDLRHFMVTQLVAAAWTGAPCRAGPATPTAT